MDKFLSGGLKCFSGLVLAVLGIGGQTSSDVDITGRVFLILIGIAGVILLIFGIISIISGVKENKVESKHSSQVTPRKLVSENCSLEDSAYIVVCIKPCYKIRPEKHSYTDNAFKNIINLLNSGNNKAACNNTKALINKYPDFGTLYAYWAMALTRMGKTDEAYNILLQGLKKSNQVHDICLELGKIDITINKNLRAAIYWFAQTIHCIKLTESRGSLIEAQAYLYLCYIAQGFNMLECMDEFRRQVNRIQYSLDLNDKIAMSIVLLARQNYRNDFSAVIRNLKKMCSPKDVK